MLRDGVTQQIGAPDEIYYRPANLYVADFVGFRNALAMTLERRDGDARRRRGGTGCAPAAASRRRRGVAGR